MSNVSYSVQNTESLYIKAKCGIIVSKTYTVTSLLRYDPCSSDNTYNYTLNLVKDGSSTSSSLIFSTDHYILRGTGDNDSGITFTEANDLDNVEVSFDVKLATGISDVAFNQCIVCITNNTTWGGHNRGYRIRGDKLFQRFYGGESTVYTHSTGYNDQWYHMIFKRQGDTISCELYNANGTLLKSDSYTNSFDWTTCYYNILIATNRGTNHIVRLRNIKVKQL